MRPGLIRRQRRRLRAEEDLEQGQVAQLGQLFRRLAEPVAHGRASLRRHLVMTPSATALLAPLAQEAGRSQALGLGVELGVLERPEVAEADRDHLLQVVGGRLAGRFEQTEDDVGGGGQSDLA